MEGSKTATPPHTVSVSGAGTLGAVGESRSDIDRGVTEDEVGKGGPPPSIDKLAQERGGEKANESEIADATDWLLSDAEDEEDIATKTVELNIGTPEHRKVIEWTFRAISSDEMRIVQRRAQQGTSSRRRAMTQGETDNAYANLLVVTEATIHPDLRGAAQSKGIADPAEVLRHRFQRKPGLIDQLAAEIMLFSGYDEDDLQDAKEVRAAGN